MVLPYVGPSSRLRAFSIGKRNAVPPVAIGPRQPSSTQVRRGKREKNRKEEQEGKTEQKSWTSLILPFSRCVPSET